MMDRNLNAVQVAALLVSASYGIGFLFGSGEMALHHGMGGSLYGLATALGMLALTVVARKLWKSGIPIWDLFGRAYGSALKNSVALLSVVWMAGVLAAQIHGGVAIIKLLRLDDIAAYVIVLVSIFAASRLNLRVASAVFAFSFSPAVGCWSMP
jgi:solute:Na+ symporter, SSS family